MTKEDFRDLLKDHMVPLLAGTHLGKTKSSSPSHRPVAYENPCALLMKPLKKENYRVQLLRSEERRVGKECRL